MKCGTGFQLFDIGKNGAGFHRQARGGFGGLSIEHFVIHNLCLERILNKLINRKLGFGSQLDRRAIVKKQSHIALGFRENMRTLPQEFGIFKGRGPAFAINRLGCATTYVDNADIAQNPTSLLLCALEFGLNALREDKECGPRNDRSQGCIHSDSGGYNICNIFSRRGRRASGNNGGNGGLGFWRNSLAGLVNRKDGLANDFRSLFRVDSDFFSNIIRNRLKALNLNRGGCRIFFILKRLCTIKLSAQDDQKKQGSNHFLKISYQIECIILTKQAIIAMSHGRFPAHFF